MTAPNVGGDGGTGLRRSASGLVFLAGAGVYALLLGPLDVGFELTPLLVGLVALAAGLSSPRRRALATGMVLTGWGAAVLAVSADAISPDRTAPAYMLGIGGGLLATALVAHRSQRRELVTSAAIAAFIAPLGLMLSYDVEALRRWPAWALTLVALAAWELFWGLRPGSRHSPP